MLKKIQSHAFWAAFMCMLTGVWVCGFGKEETPKPDVVQAQVILTVAESKRLIAKAVAQMPMVRSALQKGMVIICKGTTNTYVAEEIVGKPVAHGAYVYGTTYPEKNTQRIESVTAVSEFIFVDGQLREGMKLDDAVKQLKAGDVVIKGANALDYKNRLAGVCVGGSGAGTTGTFMPYLVGAKAHLVIPVGLEKQIAGDVLEIVKKMQEPVESLNRIPSMFLLPGHIFTEIEALESLAEVRVFQATAGGIGGAEGSVRLICRGRREAVEKALKLVEQIQGEPPFVH